MLALLDKEKLRKATKIYLKIWWRDVNFRDQKDIYAKIRLEVLLLIPGK